MKTNFIKQLIPVAVFALAIAGAFTTHAMNEHSKTFTIVTGYIRLDPDGNECEQQDDCSTINNGILCRVGYVPAGAQLYGKNFAGKCTQTVYRP
jgi:hypothetical protein